MNKRIIALAVTGALAAPQISQADGSGPTLYGRVNLAIGVNDDAANESAIVDVTDVPSRFGIKGDEDLGNGLSAFYHYEFRVNADEGSLATGKNQRLSYVGIKSDTFGTLAIGSQWDSFYDLVGTYLDPTYTLGYFGYSSFAAGPYRIDNSIKYSGDFGPVDLSATIQMDGDNEVSDSVDRWSVAGSYDTGPFMVAVAYETEKVADDPQAGTSDDPMDLFGLIAMYTGENFDLLAGYQTYTQGDSNNDGNDDIDRTLWTFSGHYNINDNTEFYGQYSWGDNKVSDDEWGDNPDQIVLGVYHNLSARTILWFEGTYVDTDTAENSEIRRYLFGLRHDF